MSKRQELEESIKALELQRGVLGDAVVDPAIAAMQKQLDDLKDEPEIPKQQRKLITVLFMDVVDSTRLMQELDPEENLEIMDTTLQKLSMQIESHSGRVTRFMGDGFLAVFGLPVARENDPENAIRAGLRILELSKNIALDLKEQWGLIGFQVRIGINTGLVVTGGITEAEDTFMGNAVNLAARLESLAPPSGLLISQNTYQHVRGLFEVETAESVMVKGFSDPIQVYSVKGVKSTDFRVKTRGIEGVETPMIGRDDEFKSLKDEFEFIVKQHTGRFITIFGDAGLGKSRLLYEFEQWLETKQNGIIFFKGRATPESLRQPFGLFRELIAKHFGILDDDSIPIVREKIVSGFYDKFHDEENLQEMGVIVGQLLGYDFREYKTVQNLLDNPRRIYDQALPHLLEYFKSLSAQNYLVIFLDDIHWADESSLNILTRFNEELNKQKILIIALSRPSLLDRRPNWENQTSYRQITLTPLTTDHSKQLVENILKMVKYLPDELMDLLVSKAEGNPYYMEELIKILLEDEIIIKEAEHWQVVTDRLVELRVPETLTGVLQVRLDNLTNEERTLLQQAAVVGRIFWDEILRYINKSDKKLDETDISNILMRLHDRELIFERQSSVFANTAEHMFKHVILREVTYESVLKSIRQIYHGLVADWLISHSGERISEFAGLIAKHLENAGKKDKAIEYLSQAADAAMSNYAVEEADAFYSKALTLTSTDDYTRRYSLLLGQEVIMDLKGNRIKQREILDSLTTLSEIFADDEKIFEVLIRKAWLRFWTGEYPEMFEIGHQAAVIAKKLKDKNLIHQASYAIAWSLLQQGDHNQAMIHAQDALSFAQQLDNLRNEGNTYNILGMISVAQGNFFSALTFLEEFLSISSKTGDRYRELTALNNIGVAYTRLGDFQSARKYYQEHVELAKKLGDKVYESLSLINMAWLNATEEKWEDALNYAKKGISKKRASEHIEAVAEGLVWEGHCWLGLGNPEKATSSYNEALTIRKQLNQTSLAMGALAGLARSALAQNDIRKAQKHVEEIITHLKNGGNLEGSWEPLRIYLTCIQVLKEVNDARYEKILQEAIDKLQRDAMRIPDEKIRQMFLERIPWHNKIMKLWKEQIDSN